MRNACVKGWARGGLALGVAGALAAVAACVDSSSSGPSDGGPDATVGDAPNGPDTSIPLPDGARPGDGATPDGAPPADAGSCTGATSGPLGLTCADFPGVAPCPTQDILTDTTKLAALQAAMKSGVLLHADIPYNAADNNIYKEKCGLEGFWDPTKATALVPPATPIPELAALFAPYSNDGHAGICASFAAPSATTDGFPAAGTYRMQFHAAYQGNTYVVRARATVSGSAAGQSFAALGLSDAGGTPALASSLVYQVGGATAPEATLWNTIVDAFSASPTAFPSASLAVQSGGSAIWNAKIELLCAQQGTPPAQGSGVVTAQDTIALAGSPGAVAYNGASQKVYVSISTVNDAGITQNAGIAVINDQTNTVASTVATTNLAVALAANPTTNRIYASEETSIDVIDGTNDTVLTKVTVPAGQVMGLAADPANNKVYALATGPRVYVLDGTNNTLATPYTFTGLNVQDSVFTGGKPSIVYDDATFYLWAIGLDSSLNGVVVSIDARNGTVLSTTTLTGVQPQSIALVADTGVVVTAVTQSGTSGVLQIGNGTTPTDLGFSPASLATCNSDMGVIGSDSVGNAAFATVSPGTNGLSAPKKFDASELTENGYVPLGITAGAPAAGGCTYYGTYTYNPNAIYTSGISVPNNPSYLVKFVSY